MKHLLDSNIFLELLLEQERAEEVRDMFGRVSSESFCISDFTLYSVGIILIRLNAHRIFETFVKDVLIGGGLHLLRVATDDMPLITDASKRFNMDFDDAYQYVLAEKHNLTIVSFDSDFDKVQQGRKTPAEIL